MNTATRWNEINGLTYRTGSYLVTDRAALRPGLTNLRSLKRYQILDADQNLYGTFRDLTTAQQHADRLALDELATLQQTTLESRRYDLALAS